MIVVQLNGGIGNQMFQYAAGLQVAKRLDVPLYLDTSLCNSKRPYLLWNFAIDAVEMSRFVQPIKCKLSCSTYQEESFAYDNAIEKIQDNTVLKGYWQSYKYFENVKKDILYTFTHRRGMPFLCKEMEQQIISDSSSLSVHIRRGDYVGNEVHPVLPMWYYTFAILKILQTTPTPHLYIFSDDIEWAKENFKLPYDTTYVDVNVNWNDYDDLWLMRKCRHHIIANSSFSWWGAWLCANPNKIVVAPKMWFENTKNNIGDLIPKEWVIV